ncbi:SUKH-3 domain-containing protein [Streptomyces sp. NPDC086835]|uniref:SUKH-3 domain-containing protein n=2 Tax=unclassified Streptomyces TaxID=2593676 RepID=UPI0037F6E7B5
MEPTGEPIHGDRPAVLEALRAAGWAEGREYDISGWMEELGGAGFEPGPLARRVWSEFGGLTIRSATQRVPPSSLRIDPVDACIDALDESRVLSRRFGENCSPLGMWAVQFRSYIAESGLVVAIGLRDMWVLGPTFAEALAHVVVGGGDESRRQQADWLR